MVGSSIKVFARLKKEHKLKEIRYDVVRKHQRYEDLLFHTSCIKDYTSPKFRFYQVFDQDSDQAIIFEAVAKPVVISVLQGFNGTIFAYGQTGSGKTYTMTGSTKKYQDRGIIPRSLQFIFSSIENTEQKPILYISYMEIYNEICYDLLHPRDSKTASCLEELPRVAVLEDKRGEARLRNLSVLPVSTEEEAMRLLFLGDTNRAIAETPLNEYSSRSHCIFTIYITSRPNDTQTLRYSKLNLVDLAGSERVYKSHITGTILNEAKHINLSLHFLQQVILALSESKRLHIPYRNSLLTFILKDSIAGNCLTAMLATLAVSKENIPETISTCKFAQRVSMVKTEPVINEVSDPFQEILLLRNEIQELKKQLASHTTSNLEEEKQPLTNMQEEECEKKIEEYLNNSEENFKIELDKKILQYCFSILKNKIKKLEYQPAEVEQYGQTFSGPCKKLQKRQKKIEGYSEPNNFLPACCKESRLLQEFMSNPDNCEKINYYTKILSSTYEKAKILALTIEECQSTINYIKEKLDVVTKTGCSNQKSLLGRELEYQQKIYRNSLMELKELQHETIQLEAGLKKARVRTMQRFQERTSTNDFELAIEKKCKEAHCDPAVSKIEVGRVRTKNLCETGQDLKLLQYRSCQCDTFGDRRDYPTLTKYPQYESYSKLREFLENKSICSCGLPRECYHKDSNAVLDNCCMLDTDESQTIQRTKYATGFLPDMRNKDIRTEHFKSKCNCNKMHNYQAPNQVCCDTDYEFINDKNMITSENIYCKESTAECECTGVCYNEVGYSSYLPTRFEDLTATNLKIKSGIQCDCNNNKESSSQRGTFVSKRTHYSKETTKHLISHQRDHGNVMENDLFALKRIDCQDFNSIFKNSNDNKTNLKYISSVTSKDYLGTQIVPIKLDKGVTTTTAIRSEETQAETFSPPDCQEKHVGNHELFKNNSDNNNRKNNIDTKKELNQNNQLQNSNIDSQEIPDREFNIFLESDTEKFRKFMENISLTGDEEIDKEICNFYRRKVSC